MKLTKRQLRKIIRATVKPGTLKEARGNPEDPSVMEAERSLKSVARVLFFDFKYNFQDICDCVDEALSGPDVALRRNDDE